MTEEAHTGSTTRPDVEHDERQLPVINLEADGIALRKAWGIYILLGLIPPISMIKTIFFLILAGRPVVLAPVGESVEWSTGMLWLYAGMTWISITTPLSFLIRRRLWAEYYAGGVVPPENYVKGNLAVWVPLVVAGVIGFLGLAHSREVASLFTSALAFILFMAMFPNGHAMTHPVGDHDDPGVYEEPK